MKAKKIVSILFVLFFAVAAVQAETSALTPQPAESTPAVQTESEVKEPEEVKIKASEGISGDKSAVNLSGDVIIEGTDFIARGSEAEVDLVEGIVRFTGGVTVDQKDRQFVGEELVYNYKTKAGTIVGVSGNIENEKLKGDLYIYGQEMRFEDDYIHITGGKITTCDLGDPHYHIAAKEIEIYQDDRLVLRHLFYKEGNLPLLYFPYYTISLKERTNYLKFPKIGSSSKEGFYIKFTYVYTLNDANKGEIYLDFMEKLGIGQGVSHNFAKDKTGLSGKYYLIYSPRENALKLADLSGSAKTEVGAFQLNANGSYKDDLTEFSPKHLRSSSLSATYRGDVYSGSLRASYSSEATTSPVKKEFKLESGNTLRLSREWRLTLNGSLIQTQKAVAPWQTTVNYDSTLNYTGQRLQGTLRFQLEDRSQEQDTSYTKLLRQPELILRSRGLKIFDWPLTLETVVGNYKEQPSNVTSNKLGLKGTLGRKTYKLTKTLEFSTLFELQGTTYDIKDFDPYVLSWRGNLGLSFKPVQNWTFSTDYTKRNAYGNSPFSFDKISDTHTVDFRIYNTYGFISNEAKTGYDLLKSTLKNLDLVHRFTFRSLTASFEHSYKLKPFEPVKYAGSLNIKPNGSINLQGRVNYAKESGQWKLKQLNGQGQVDIGPFRLQGQAAFNVTTNKYSTLQATFGIDMHCRRIDFTYDHVNKAVWFEFRIYAIGDKPMRLKVSDSGLDFSSDMLTALSSGN